MWLVHHGSRTKEEGLKLQDRFSKPDENDPVWQILSRYIHLKWEVLSNRRDGYFSCFHHDLLVSEGFLPYIEERGLPLESIENKLIGILQRAGEIHFYDTNDGTVKWDWMKNLRWGQIIGNKFEGMNDVLNAALKAMFLDSYGPIKP
ncbi:hypothetical protein KXQ82_01990 [Mucilaginibacter sp. HMF5004]|uniref:hypothetical protein n=1 Tax=Mucilaginibacter rivuli TaxID=2857527 RepID=UPI001C5F1873|nr:hypothetical protein [Mucilaginibacter rivuli]MBW4888461.1 hypothetical protein [Mucilaginibacter rivuli]